MDKAIWAGLGASALSGLLLAAAMPNADVGVLAWVALVPLLLALESLPQAPAMGLTLPFGMILSIVAHRWYPAILGPALGYPLIIGVGFWYAALVRWGVQLQRRLGGALGWLALPVLWSALEFLKFIAPVVEDWWFVTLATSQWRSPPALQILTLTGFPGLSFMLMLANVALATLLAQIWRERRAHWPSVAALAGLAALVAWGAAGIPAAPAQQFSIGATQDLANQDPAIRALSTSFTGVEGPYADTPAVSQALFAVNAALTRPLAAQGAAFVVWPENELADTDDPQVRAQLGRLAQETRAYIVADTVWHTAAGLHDTALLIGPDGREVGRQAKINITSYEKAYGFVPGPRTFPVFDTPYGKVGLAICWDRHRTWIIRELARAGAQLVLMPVDDDFRDPWFPAYHAADSVFRAVENRVAVATGTTSGIAQVIDPYGRISAESAIDTRSAIIGQTFTVAERTVYTRFGDWFGWATVAGLAAMLLAAGGRAATHRPPGA